MRSTRSSARLKQTMSTSSFPRAKNGSIGFRSSTCFDWRKSQRNNDVTNARCNRWVILHSQGDITRLAVGAIVNAANHSLLGMSRIHRVGLLRCCGDARGTYRVLLCRGRWGYVPRSRNLQIEARDLMYLVLDLLLPSRWANTPCGRRWAYERV